MMQIYKVRSKAQRRDMFQSTIPQWEESKKPLPFNSGKARGIHKSIFELIIIDSQPFSIVNDPGFLRFCQHAYCLAKLYCCF